MAPLPSNNTSVYFVFYTSGGNSHTTQVRTDSISPSVFGTTMDTFFQALEPNLFEMTVDTVTFRPALSTVSNPVVTGIEGNAYGSGTPITLEEPQYVDFVGRSSGGRRNRITIFGISDLGANYRISAGEFTSVDDVITLLSADPDFGIAIDGLATIWKTYANTGQNYHWQRKQR